MRDLGERMHAGIGAASTGYGDGFTRQLPDRVLERRLHRRPVLLSLPTGKWAAVIFQRETITHCAMRRVSLLPERFVFRLVQRTALQLNPAVANRRPALENRTLEGAETVVELVDGDRFGWRAEHREQEIDRER